MDYRNAKLSLGSDLFTADVLEKAVDKSSKVLQDDAIRKAFFHDKPASKMFFISPSLRARSNSQRGLHSLWLAHP